MFLFRDWFAIPPSQCTTKGSAGQFTHTILVARTVHNVPIALPASPPAILFRFEHTIAFQPVHLFHIYTHILWFEYVWICFVLFHVSRARSDSDQINTFLVARPAHNILIALPASPSLTLFWFAQTIPISLVYSWPPLPHRYQTPISWQ